jgi:very-short-patch-repair endonuclease
MALTGIRKIPTPFKKLPTTTSKAERVRIPQPLDRPFGMKGRSAVDRAWLRGEGVGILVHKKGERRIKVEGDPREARAIPASQVRGSLPERMVYLSLIKDFHLDGQFDFQSSQLGGRMELGGMVADFWFEGMKIVIQVQGVTHKGYLRGRKDEEQDSILAGMGYRVYNLYEDDIYDAFRLENELRKIFNLGVGVGGGTGFTLSEEQGIDSAYLAQMLNDSQYIYDALMGVI